MAHLRINESAEPSCVSGHGVWNELEGSVLMTKLNHSHAGEEPLASRISMATCTCQGDESEGLFSLFII